MNQPERLEALDLRIARHERLTRGLPKKAFKDVLAERLAHGREKDEANRRSEQESRGQDEEEPGAREALIGLSPGQDAMVTGSTRRSAKVIVKG